MDEASINELRLAGEERQCLLSENGAASLVRLVRRRRLAQFAGSIGASNVAFRGITPDLATAIQAVTKSGVDAGQIGAVTHITNLLWDAAALSYAPAARRSTPESDDRKGGGFHKASIAAAVALSDDRYRRTKCSFAGRS